MAEPPTPLPDPRRFGRAWAKTEIFLGLAAAGAGLLLGNRTFARPLHEVSWTQVAAGLALFVLGGYLALAGHRSHLYRSNIELRSSLVEEIHRLKDKVESQ
ncbi:MAG TPA: hypothetical protein VEL76_20995 [Gemmataceae bacterium]|nr:hypothetical protein [Gemmataceae bacterium]